jgi:hypothetical protein
MHDTEQQGNFKPISALFAGLGSAAVQLLLNNPFVSGRKQRVPVCKRCDGHGSLDAKNSENNKKTDFAV